MQDLRSQISGKVLRLLAAGCLVLPLAVLSGCGAEKQNTVENPNPTAVPVQGMSEAEYRQQMQDNAKRMQGGGGGGAMPGAGTTAPPGPGGGAPTAPGGN